LRFHLWRHSHSVPVRWPKEEAAAEVAVRVAQGGLAVEREEQPAPQAAATTLLNPPVAKAVRVAILLPNLPAAPGRTASIPQGRELGQEAPVPA
jgi:hypothetical protein